MIPLAARKAASVITISRFSKSRIQKHLGIPDERIEVVHVAPKSPPVDRMSDAAYEQFRIENRIGGKYILTVSHGLPYKNATGLVAGFRQFQETFSTPHELLFVGQTDEDLRSQGVRPQAGVRALGFASETQLHGLYRNACGFILPSLYEGFGMPTLEAMQHGIPVACSNVASLPEIVGKAAVLFDPRSTQSISVALAEVLLNVGRREQLVIDGRTNLRRFSWHTCAEATLRILTDAARLRSRPWLRASDQGVALGNDHHNYPTTGR